MKSSSPTPRPWQRSDWPPRQAAAHLLDRLSYGATPAGIDEVVDSGIEGWLEAQIAGVPEDTRLERKLSDLDLLEVSVREFPERVPNPGALVAELRSAGVLPDGADPQNLSDSQRRELRPKAARFFRERGYSTRREYVGQLVSQKVWRARYSRNQLHEVMADFWFNHFNVSLTDNQCRSYVLAYERDAIRPHLLGNFRELLGATARHPAMLRYLDNAQSTADEGRRTTLDTRLESRVEARGRNGRRRPARHDLGERMRRRRSTNDRPAGLNENYARELMELHTLGVDGGYDQADVVEVARAFTGWSTYPPREFLDRAGGRFQQAIATGIVEVDEGFLFRSDAHDAESKRVLDRRLAAGRGLEDGEEVLDLLAAHPATARFIARKLAVRFVSDAPSPRLVDHLARVFSESRGGLAAMVRHAATSAEFWQPSNRGQKIKSPLELTVSALRALDADVDHIEGLYPWLERMGQPLYAYEAPTGFPDRAEHWVNAGALLSRMNFGLTLAAGGIRGVRVDLDRVTAQREPESRREALTLFASHLLAERDFDPEPLLALTEDPELAARVRRDADEEGGTPSRQSAGAGDDERFIDTLISTPEENLTASPLEPRALAQVAGVVLGSPEFQRR